MNIKLIGIRLNNFKGIRNAEYVFDGQDVSIYGDNGTGKTTLMDAMMWILFNKDSTGAADFQIKTIEDGKVIPNIDHEVECVFSIDGKPVKLRKNYKEIWTKRRGSVHAEFTGHETKHYIDDVPKKKSEYTAFIDSVIDEKRFQLLTNPLFFNENLKWQERREVLIDICGDVTIDEAIQKNKGLKSLKDILGDRTTEEHMAMIGERRRNLNREIKELETRISEVQHNPIYVKETLVELTEARMFLETDLDRLNIEVRSVMSDDVPMIKEHINSCDAVINRVKQQFSEMVLSKLQEFQKERGRFVREKSDISTAMSKAQSDRQMLERRIEETEEELEQLRHDYRNVHVEIPNPGEPEGACPLCGRDLPADEVERMREKAMADCNMQRAKLKEKIDRRGKALSAKQKEMKKELADTKDMLLSFDNNISHFDSEIRKLDEKITDLESRSLDNNPEYVKAMEEKAYFMQALTKERQKTVPPELELKMQQVKNKISEVNEKIAQTHLQEEQNKRLRELANRKVAASKELQQVDKEWSLVEDFVRQKVSMLEEKINARFKLARFQMFIEQINGGIAETCETTYKGVPYSTGLNSAMRINVGMDIINTLSQHFNLFVPVFVDNAESVTQLMDIDTQVIRLVVDELQPKMKLEVN